MRIGGPARLAGVSTRAVRHHHAWGVLPEPRRRANGHREHDGTDLLRLLRVAPADRLGVGGRTQLGSTLEAATEMQVGKAAGSVRTVRIPVEDPRGAVALIGAARAEGRRSPLR